jgi:hypothetical protein
VGFIGSINGAKQMTTKPLEKELSKLEAAYAIAKDLGLHKNVYWSSIKRSIDLLKTMKSI